jgi:Kelch motif
MPGSWTQVASICSSRRTIALARCDSWADEGSNRCSRWADEGSNQCTSWADEGSNHCSSWADEGSNHCCDWAPCSWFCEAFYWVAKWVCKGWYWVAKWVCKAWYWVANWVCQAWYWVAKWVCKAWTWIFYVFCSDADGGALFLLTDGTVLMNESSGGYGTRHWWKLTPDASGSYVNGNWTQVADSNNGRKYFASAVLADGRLLVCGGEYSDTSGSNQNDDTSASEIYDPLANTWTPVSPPSGVTQIGDSPCCVLADGRFLLGSFNGTSSFLRDPATGNWTAAGANGAKGDSGSEETWVLMADGTVVVPQCQSSPNAEMYIVSQDKWTADGTLQASIVEASSIETGPGLLLTDGRAFFVGATGNTALYQSGATDTEAGTWSAGPQLPQTRRGGQNQGAKDGPAALLPSGTVLFPIAPVDGVSKNYNSPSSFYEFDGTNVNRSSDPPNANCPTYVGRLPLLPTGQVLWVREDDNSFYVYTETGQPQSSSRPVITASPPAIVPGATVSISGTQFNGLSQAVSYGDDYAAATNYPIVRITNKQSGTIRYCRTANHTTTPAGTPAPSMGVATGAEIVTTEVTIPGDIELGASDLVVVANGIPSVAADVVVRREGDRG